MQRRRSPLPWTGEAESHAALRPGEGDGAAVPISAAAATLTRSAAARDSASPIEEGWHWACASTCSISTCRRSASRSGRRARAMRRACWWCGRRRAAARRPHRARSAGPPAAGRRARPQRHQGDPGAPARPAHARREPRRASRCCCTSARAPSAGAPSRGRPSASPSATASASARPAESTACVLARLDAEVEAKGEGGEVALRFAFAGPRSSTRPIARLGDMPLPPYIAGKRAADERDRSRLPDASTRARRAPSRRRPPGCISPTTLFRRARRARHRACTS